MSNIIEITDVNEALALLRRAVEAKGVDFIDPQAGVGCVYFTEEGTPGCIIGHVLHYKGLTFEDTIQRTNEDYSQWNSGVGITDADDHGLVKLSHDVRQVFAVAQDTQDTGGTWGQALADAQQTADELAA